MLTRLNIRPRTRADYADQVSPWSGRVDHMWSIVRGADPTQFQRSGRTVREEGFQQNAVVGACIRVIADQVASVRLQSYKTNDDGEVTLTPTSPLQQLLDQPAPQLPGFTFRRMLTTHFAMYGNGYAEIRREGHPLRGKPVGLRMVHPERLQQVLIDSEFDEIAAYVWNDSSGNPHRTLWTNMVHVKDVIVDPDGWFGYPRGAAAIAAIATDGEASQYVRQVVTNSGIPGIIMMAEDGADTADLRKAEEQWQEKMVKRGGRGGARWLTDLKDIKVVGHTLSELEFPSLRGITREDICSAFGVDPVLIGASSADKSSGGMGSSKYQEARRKLEQLTCAPIRSAFIDAIDSILTPEFGFEFSRFDPDAIGALLETPTEITTRAKAMLEAGATIEEARRAQGLPEELDPTHHVLVPSIRTVAKAIELSELPPPAALPPGEGSNNADDKKSVRAAEAPKQLTARPQPTSRAIRGKGQLTKSQRTTLWRAIDARARNLEPAFRDRAQALFAIELATVTQIVMDADDTRAAGAPQTRKSPSFYDRVASAVASYYAPKGEARDAWQRGFTPDISFTVNEAASSFAADIGVSFDLRNPRVIEAVRDRVNKLSGHVAETTLKQLRVIIAAGREAGQDAEQIARAIRAGVLDPAITADRAQVIAETETMGAINEGEWQAANESGVMQSIGWLPQADEFVRESHDECGKEGWIALGATFSNGLRYPHDPKGEAKEVVRCRCGAIYSDLSPDEAHIDQPIGANA